MGDSVILDNLLKVEYQLFIFIPQNLCFDCFHELFNEVDENLSEVKDQVIVLGSYADIRTLYMLFNRQRNQCEVYNIPANGLECQFEGSGKISLFILNQSGVVEMFYQVQKGEIETTQEYLRIVLNRFLNK